MPRSIREASGAFVVSLLITVAGQACSIRFERNGRQIISRFQISFACPPLIKLSTLVGILPDPCYGCMLGQIFSCCGRDQRFDDFEELPAERCRGGSGDHDGGVSMPGEPFRLQGGMSSGRISQHRTQRKERGSDGWGMGWLPKLQGLSSLDRTGASSRAGEEVLETEHALPEEKKSNRLAVVHP